MISQPLSRRTLFRGTAGVGVAALLRPHGIAAAYQDVPADAAATQELRIAAATNFLRLDPHLSYHVYSIGVFTYQMWAGLTKMDENLNVEPDIATSWEVSDDGKIYTFQLDPERKFSDGSPITAHDVVWSWTRSLDPATESLVAGGYLEDVVDAQNYWQGEIPDPPTSYQAIDDYTFQVELIQPKNYFPEILIHPSTFVLKQSDVEAGSDEAPWFETATAFSGPYAMASYSPGESLELTANPHYPIPHGIERISFRLVEDPQTQFLLYQNDEVDFTPLGVPDAANIINDDPTYREELIQQPQWWEENLYLRTQQAPFDDERVRRAFMMAIDKDLLLATVLQGLNPDINSIFYPGMDVYSDNLPRIEFDPEAAREELAQSSYGSAEALPAISFYIPADGQTGTETRFVAAMQEMWRQNLGVEVQSRVVATYAEMLDSDVQIALGGEALHYPDASGVSYFTCESGANIAQFCDPEVDAMMLEAASTQDMEQSVELYQQVQTILTEQAVILPLYQVVSFFLVKPYVKNLQTTAMFTFPNFEDVYIAEQ